MRRNLRWVLIVSIAGCSGGANTTTGSIIDGPIGSSGPAIGIAPATVTFSTIGESIQLVATQEANATNPLVWSSSDPSRVSVTQTGVATAVRTTVVTVNVCAAYAADPSKKGCSGVSVQTP